MIDDIIRTCLSSYSTEAVIFVCISGFVAGLARGFSGFVGALIFIPLASAALGPKVASPLLLVMDSVLALTMLPEGWRKADRREVSNMIIGALVGLPIGTALLALAPSEVLRWGISVVVFTLLAFLLTGWRYHGRPKTRLTVGVGGISGVFGGAAQMSGPPIVAYWLGGAIASATVRANLILYFAFSSAIPIVLYFLSGLITRDVLILSIGVAPFYGIAMIVGTGMFGIFSQATFRRVCFSLIFLAGVFGLPVFDTIT